MPEHEAEAMETLCRAYWYPLYAYVRRDGHAPHDAQDLTQEFFARLLEKDWLQAAGPEHGRFRTFLLVAMKRFLINEWHKNASLANAAGTSRMCRSMRRTRSAVSPASRNSRRMRCLSGAGP
jgi:DNA-directed RNA polymerase specialized sigma24 family protein